VQPKYLLIDEIEHLKPEYLIMLLSLMETGILTQTMHSKVRHMHLKTWVFATSNSTKKLSEPLLSRYNTKRRHMSLNWDQLETSVQAFYKKIDRRRKQLPFIINI
jgi:MoxR-like ATPase